MMLNVKLASNSDTNTETPNKRVTLFMYQNLETLAQDDNQLSKTKPTASAMSPNPAFFGPLVSQGTSNFNPNDIDTRCLRVQHLACFAKVGMQGSPELKLYFFKFIKCVFVTF